PKKNLHVILTWDKSNVVSGPPEETIWHFITDLDESLQNILMRRCLKVPALRAEYLESLTAAARLAGGTDGFLSRQLEREYSQTHQAPLDDTKKPPANSQYEAEVSRLRDFLQRRADLVLAQVTRDLAPLTEHPFSLTDRSAMTLATVGASDTTLAGYARVAPTAGQTTPAGLAVFAFRKGGVLVSEAGVPSSTLVTSGRVYAEAFGAASTGIAIANPNDQTATINYYFTDPDGTDYGQSSTTIPAPSQIAELLNQGRFNGVAPARRT